jgi:hypothetical protein
LAGIARARERSYVRCGGRAGAGGNASGALGRRKTRPDPEHAARQVKKVPSLPARAAILPDPEETLQGETGKTR